MSRIVNEIVGLPRPETRRRVWIAVALAFGTHALLWLWALESEPSLEAWSAQIAAQVHAELSREVFVETTKPPPPPAPAPIARTPAAVPRSLSPRSERPPPPAQAGAIVAKEPDPSEPVDLTADPFVTGTAAAYAGGVTSAFGTNPVAVQAQEVDPKGRPGAVNHSSAVSLEQGDWACPWPREADAEQIDEQTVVIRAFIRADGTAESAQVISDPGHGFGPAAVACALRTRFSPAHDNEGRAIRSKSPPIRVRFTR